MAKFSTFSEFSVLSAQIYDQTIKTQNNFYFFIGKPTPWPEELNPEEMYDSREGQTRTWRNMLAIKKVNASDVTSAFNKADWVSGTVYDEYRHDYSAVNLAPSGADRLRYSKNYAVNTAKQVFKCIFNNNNSPSTEMPQVVSEATTEIFELSDGYRWKYLFTIDSAQLEKFVSPIYYPFNLENEAVKLAAVPGGIHNIVIKQRGAQFPALQTLPIFVDGDGLLNASAMAGIATSGLGEILGTSIIDAGNSYEPSATFAVNFLQPTTNGTIKTAYGLATTNALGQIESVSIVIPGEGYLNSLPIRIVESSCKPMAQIDAAGQIEKIIIYNGKEGFNFNRASAVIVSATGTGYELQPVISPLGGHGAFQAFEVGAFNVLMNVRLLASDEDFPLDNDFRSFGVIASPMTLNEFYQPVPFTGEVGSGLFVITPSDVNETIGEFKVDDKIYGLVSGAVGTVVSVIRSPLDNSVEKLHIIRTEEDNELNYYPASMGFGETITSSSGASATVADMSLPDFIKGLGVLIYAENRIAIKRNVAQSESITIAVEL